ncbi:MAG TPA: FeoB-associated Cys-rich membrane protein [Cyclobacteriaceae bacterium]|nr:FeoB-associated Cys-rich membrane protein [Cyclobacteriaceae bacterium]
MQQILVMLIFAGAVAYIGKVIYDHLTAKSGCASGCGKCGSLDIKKIEEQFKAKSLQKNLH